jgi:long-chain acyl-CoA synthetase
MPELNAFKIIDRKKNIFKLQQGEYVAPEKVEHIYGKAGLLNASEIFLHGDSFQNFTVMIATPEKERLLNFAKESGFEADYETLIRDRDFRRQVLLRLNEIGKKEGLYSFELAKNIYFESEGFTGKNIMTSTMKLMRFDAR